MLNRLTALIAVFLYMYKILTYIKQLITYQKIHAP